MPPTVWVASAATAHSYMLGAQIAMRSPGSMPPAIIARAGNIDRVRELGERQAHVAVDDGLTVTKSLRGAGDELWNGLWEFGHGPRIVGGVRGARILGR